MEINKASQPIRHSLAESLTSTAVGFFINVWAQTAVFPLLGIHIPLSENLTIAVIFTVISVVRQFILRRVYNWYHLWRLSNAEKLEILYTTKQA